MYLTVDERVAFEWFDYRSDLQSYEELDERLTHFVSPPAQTIRATIKTASNLFKINYKYIKASVHNIVRMILYYFSIGK